MARELNREIFGLRESSDGALSNSAAPAPTFAKAEEVRALALHFETLSRRMKEFESRVETLHTKVDELVTQNRNRFERVQSHFKGQSEMLGNAIADINAKIAHVVSRMNERKLNETVVKEMVDRHGQVVQAFEIRVQQIQKVTSEQELQLMHARSELKQALQELARLKKF